MQHPIQRIRSFASANAGQRRFIAATAGPKLYIFDAITGLNLFSWPSSIATAKAPSTGAEGAFEPPEKRRKLSSPLIGNDVCPEPSESNQTGPSEKPSPTGTSWASIPILVPTNSGDHIVAVTAEDKCIRVFEVANDGKLFQLSARSMPKRPCAVALIGDDSTLITADKLGDVYSLPLFPTSKPVQQTRKNPDTPRNLRLSASTLTVHTKKNIEALEQQKRLSAKVTSKAGPEFERSLLLGHVSMLTDIIFVSLPVSEQSNTSHGYILTSDRDEHIRISRSPPQAHIIEGYCLGHTSFLTKLCVPQWDRRILISGGGDDYILVWDWPQSHILQKVTLDENPDADESKAESSAPEITVSGIWSIPFGGDVDSQSESPGAILVAMEGVAKLLPFVAGADRRLVPQKPIELPGNILDVDVIDNSGQILVSVDNVHKPGSMKILRSASSSPEQFLLPLTLSVGQNGLNWEKTASQAVDTINEYGTSDIATSENEMDVSGKAEALAESLYTLGNLRKMGRG